MEDRDIYTTEAEPGDVQIRLSYPTRTGIDVGEDERHVASLNIIDRTSGQILVEVEMSAAEYLSFMSGTGTNVSGATLPARPDRIGLRRQNTGTEVPYVSGESPAEAQARLDAVVGQYRLDGWDTEVRRTNRSGIRVIARRYIDADGNPIT